MSLEGEQAALEGERAALWEGGSGTTAAKILQCIHVPTQYHYYIENLKARAASARDMCIVSQALPLVFPRFFMSRIAREGGKIDLRALVQVQMPARASLMNFQVAKMVCSYTMEFFSLTKFTFSPPLSLFARYGVFFARRGLFFATLFDFARVLYSETSSSDRSFSQSCQRTFTSTSHASPPPPQQKRPPPPPPCLSKSLQPCQPGLLQ